MIAHMFVYRHIHDLITYLYVNTYTYTILYIDMILLHVYLDMIIHEKREQLGQCVPLFTLKETV